jgi:hypothetical protein
MPVGLVRKLAVAAIIAAAIGVIACKDGDDDPPGGSPGGGTTGGGTTGGGTTGGGTTGGGMDSGTPGGGTGGGDAATDSGRVTYEAGAPCMGWDGGPVQCGTKQCFWHNTPLTCGNPSCLNADASICGIDTKTLGGVDAGLPEYIPYDAPGADSPGCGAVVDMNETIADGGVDAGQIGNGKIDTTRSVSGLTIFLRYPGCCTAEGYCSGNTGKGEAMVMGTGMWNMSNAGYGCLNNRIFFAANPAAQNLRCNPADGGFIPPTDGGGGGGDGGSDAGADGGPSDGGDGGNS